MKLNFLFQTILRISLFREGTQHRGPAEAADFLYCGGMWEWERDRRPATVLRRVSRRRMRDTQLRRPSTLSRPEWLRQLRSGIRLRIRCPSAALERVSVLSCATRFRLRCWSWACRDHRTWRRRTSKRLTFWKKTVERIITGMRAPERLIAWRRVRYSVLSRRTSLPACKRTAG